MQYRQQLNTTSHFCAVQYRVIQYVASHRSCSVVRCSTVWFNEYHYSAVEWSWVYCNIGECSDVMNSALTPHHRIARGEENWWLTDPSLSLHCTALHCTVIHCNELHYTALHCTVTHCNELYSTVIYHTDENMKQECWIIPWGKLYEVQCTLYTVNCTANSLKMGKGRHKFIYLPGLVKLGLSYKQHR